MEKEKEMAKVGEIGVKVVEKNGKKLVDILTRSDPWGEDNCGRSDCRPCSSSEGDRYICRTPNVTYVNTCTLCKKEGRMTEYIGETSRTLYERMREHDMKCSNKEDTSHMHKHLEEEHRMEIVERGLEGEGHKMFSVRVAKSHRSSFVMTVT